MTEEDAYRELTEAKPEQLLDAALWFYCDENARRFLRLGFKLARPDGWRHIAPHWLQVSKELSGDEEEKEIDNNDD